MGAHCAASFGPILAKGAFSITWLEARRDNKNGK
jgi:hypothetical protein